MTLYGAAVHDEEVVDVTEIDSVLSDTRHRDGIAQLRQKRAQQLPVRLIRDEQANRRLRRSSDDREAFELAHPPVIPFSGGHTIDPSSGRGYELGEPVSTPRRCLSGSPT